MELINDWVDDQPRRATPGRFCPRCGQPTIRGRVADRNSTYFVPDDVANPFALSPNVPVTAFACNHCGLLRFAIAEEDQAHLHRLVLPGRFWRGVGRAVGRTLIHFQWWRRHPKPALETK